MNNLNRITFLLTLLSILISCQKNADNNQIKMEENMYLGKWLAINKEGSYYYCTDSDKSIEISKNKIYDHTPVEDSNFSIDHVKSIKNQTYLYLDNQESSYYILKWVDKEKGIISIKLNNYDANLFIIDNKIKSIENKSCQPKSKLCEFKDAHNNYKFQLEPGEYTNEKEQKYPISAWILITNNKNKNSQEIYFEPNSWAMYPNLPCSDFIINDFNFDGLVDFAIVWDNGGNSGKLYEYYFQDKDGKFSPDDAFPLQHGMLAEDINTSKKTITTKSIVGCCNYNINQYTLKNDGKWETSSVQKKM